MSADNRDEDSLRTAQHDLKEYDWVDICIGNPKYAIVTKGLILHSWHGCITRRQVGICNSGGHLVKEFWIQVRRFVNNWKELYKELPEEF